MSGAAPCLMIQGTASGVGKSLLAAAFCRIFARAGYRVAPFKSQNMALNAAVTLEGGEIGRAQAAQAAAAGIEPTVDMNPILLKPEPGYRSQLVVRGRAVTSVTWREYQRMQAELLPVVAESLARLRQAWDLVIIEGAGSPAEINLRDSDIVNMRVARIADAPVLLVGDIDRGGVFAALLGTLALLDPPDRARVGGLIVNRFRGDETVLTAGLTELGARSGVPVLGVVPYLDARLVPAEDSLDLDEPWRWGAPGTLDVAVVRLPHISNFDDFEPLAAEPGVGVRFVRGPDELGDADAVVLPGSKSTVSDLQWLAATGLAQAIRHAAADGRPIVGVCGGYQMLGEAVHDPDRVESGVSSAPALGLLPVVTTFAPDKTTVRVRARVAGTCRMFSRAAGSEVVAYEIHAGRTSSSAPRPFTIEERGGVPVRDADGAVSAAGNVVGTYLHGLFTNDSLRRAFLQSLADRKGIAADPRWGAPGSDRYERLADAVARAVDIAGVAKLAGLSFPRS
ncbi:MAG: cobyric acid synthase CobQ [Candidatus Rokuibacteriota bacterium]|nr:MAG: cobyric acid synthase CobQ [Candidatus Rokubacteria bacterium]